MNLSEIRQDIINDPANARFTDEGWQPLFQASPNAKILIIGQEPGFDAQLHELVFDDESGRNLCRWLGISKDTLYNKDDFAILPMDFYYQGKDAEGGVRPPRPEFWRKWHQLIIDQMPDIQLTILLGSYAVHAYLDINSDEDLTPIVKDFRQYLPKYFPLIYPSGRNNIWIVEHPWFKEGVIPVLREIVDNIIE